MFINLSGFNHENQNIYFKLAQEQCENLKKDYHVVIIPIFDGTPNSVHVFYPEEAEVEDINLQKEFIKKMQFKNIRVKLDDKS